MAEQDNNLPTIPARLMMKGVDPNDLKAAFSDKVRGILGNDNTITDHVKSLIEKSVHTVIKHVVLRENKDGSLDRRRRSNVSNQVVGVLPSKLTSPSKLQERTQGIRGITKYSKEITEAYHVAQDRLFQLINIEAPRDLSTKDFCNLIDGVTSNRAKELFVTLSDWFRDRKMLTDLVTECKSVLTQRIAGDWAVTNDLMTFEGWSVWRDHMNVIVSFGALLVVLDMLCEEHHGSSYLSQLS